jgi:hypothetical protein
VSRSDFKNASEAVDSHSSAIFGDNPLFQELDDLIKSAYIATTAVAKV